METDSFTLKVRMLKSEAMETPLYGCVTWTLDVGTSLCSTARTASSSLIIGSHRRHCTDHRML